MEEAAKTLLGRSVRIARRSVLLLGWLALIGAAGWIVVERSGLLTRWAERVLAWRLGPELGDVRLAHARIDWTTRTLFLEGCELGEAGRELTLDELTLRVGWGLEVERVVAARGHLRVSRALLTGLEALLEKEDRPRSPDAHPPLPLRGL